MAGIARLAASAALLALGARHVAAISLDVNDTNSIIQAASIAAFDLVSYYKGNDSGQTPGLLPQPYYWWEAGGMFNSLINYWYYTGDSTYNDITTQGILFQVGPGDAFMPPNQTLDEGNDDQVFWAFAAMTAAEYNFPNPPPDQPSWLSLAQGVFNTQAERWDYATCGGGLRWQFNPVNPGYVLKTSAANGGFFNLAARLAAYTGNTTYEQWAVKSWNWMADVGIISPSLVVYDNTNIENNCTTLDHQHWTYTTGIIMNGAATMWNITQSDLWGNRTLQMWNNCIPFFFVNNPPMVMREPCEIASAEPCDTDQISFKGYLARFMAASTKVAPFMYDLVKPYLAASASAAAEQCDGGSNSTQCGFHWSWGSKWDGTMGVSQQIAALEVIQSNLIHQVAAPVTSKKGGTSKSNPSAGTNINPISPVIPVVVVTTKDRVGAGILTAVLIMFTVGGACWILHGPMLPIKTVKPQPNMEARAMQFLPHAAAVAVAKSNATVVATRGIRPHPPSVVGAHGIRSHPASVAGARSVRSPPPRPPRELPEKISRMK